MHAGSGTGDAIIDRVIDWARGRPDVVGLALVGSCARGTARPESDIDLILLTDEPAAYVQSEDWLGTLAPATIVRTRTWGAVVERRLRLALGPEVEVGIASPSWASVQPVDVGTLRVVRDGMRILYDPSQLLRKLEQAVSGVQDDGLA
jgi:uncharacterized protein